jgi:hypothetical protein
MTRGYQPGTGPHGGPIEWTDFQAALARAHMEREAAIGRAFRGLGRWIASVAGRIAGGLGATERGTPLLRPVPSEETLRGEIDRWARSDVGLVADPAIEFPANEPGVASQSGVIDLESRRQAG